MMAVQSPPPLSSMCRRQEHRMCEIAEARCGCSCHGPRGQTPPQPKKNTTKEPTMPERALASVPAPSKKSADEPVITLQRKDPPLPPKKATLVEQVTEKLDEVHEDDTDWFLVVLFDSSRRAAVQRSKLAKAIDGFEFLQAAGEVYARRTVK